MAQALAVGNILKIIPFVQDTDQVSMNTFHYRVSAVGGSPATDLDAATFFDGFIAALIKPIINNNATYRGILVQRVFPIPVPISQEANANAGAGTGGATSLPRQSAGLTSWYTALAGQRNRGRTYWPFPPTAADTGDGVPTAGYQTNINTLSNTLITPIPVLVSGRSATLMLGIYHRAGNTISDVVTWVIRQSWATQRRRGTYGRQNVPPF